MSRMLYKYPGSLQLDEGGFETIIVEDDAVDEMILDGWRKTSTEAKELALSGIEEAAVEETTEKIERSKSKKKAIE